jgi:nucleoside-diphosphate-sugar epimerase
MQEQSQTGGESALPDRYRPLAGRRVLVTGAAGFIGGALLRRLVEYGLDVTATVRDQDEARALRAHGHRVDVLDLASDAEWDAMLRGVDVVFNVAALFQEVEEGESMYRAVNVDGTLRLARTAARAGVRRFVHCSTVGVHGHVKEIPCTERTPFNPMDEYHRSKLAGEVAVLALAGGLPADGMVVTVNRPAMVYGPGDMRMLKLFKAIASRRFVMIGSGRTLAHLGYIEDQVDSFLLCAVAPREHVHGEAFNIASDAPLSLDDLVRVIAECAGVPPPRLRVPVAPVWAAAWLCEIAFKPLGRRPPLFRRRVGFFTHDRAFDLTKARTRLGYHSQWDTRTGVAATLSWYRGQGLLTG